MEKSLIQSLTIRDHEEFLRQKSLEVDILHDKELKRNIEVLEQFCKANEVMAMAAVQLGIPKRIVYLKNTNLDVIAKLQKDDVSQEVKDYNEARVLINPVILKREGLTEYWEACASCLDACGRVLRPYKILVHYLDVSGNAHDEEFVGFEATVLSHEMDHLDGILHIDIALEVLELTREERKKWRQTHDYKIYFQDEDYETLKKEFKDEGIESDGALCNFNKRK